MNNTPNRSVELFTEALQLPATERATYLQNACGGDEQLQSRVEALLKANDHAEGFLEQSPQPPQPV